jgi:hypothetical protein
MDRSRWNNGVASILKSKDGKKLYLKFNNDVTLSKDTILTIEKKEDEIDRSLQSGRISEEKAQELKEKLHFVKYELHLPPEKE